MPKSSTMLRLLGAFTIEVSAGRAVVIPVRSRKARALLAYLAMKPQRRASREELATLLWGDTPDAQARHSLRQCVMSLRQDLRPIASDLLDIDRETIELRAQDLAVDACELLALAASTQTDELARAAALSRGAFLADLALDIEPFESWRRREQDRMADAAARVFETLCAAADAAGHGEAAIAAADRLVALDPTREDRQRTALAVHARHRGPEAALERARQLAALLRSELDIAPDMKTRALVAAIRAQAARDASPAALPHHAPSTAVASLGATQTMPAQAPTAPPPVSPPHARTLWRRRPIAAALVAIGAVSVGAVAALGIATGGRLPFGITGAARTPPGVATVVVLPFAVDPSRGAEDRAFARLLTYDLTADLTRYGDLRVVSDRTADRYSAPEVDVAAVGQELGVPYAVVGRVQRTDAGLRTNVQLIDTATRMTLWSDHVQRDGDEGDAHADEVAHGLAHALVINMVVVRVQRLRHEPGQPPPIADLLLRARLGEIRGYRRDTVAQALALYESVLRRAPNNATAKLGVARMTIIAAMNFIDLDHAPDLTRAEALLGGVLEQFPNWAAAHYTLGLLQKYRRQYDAGLKSLQRSLELNPSFLHARGQIGALLTRMGQPENGLRMIEETIRLATPNDPSRGFFYLFAGEAELELGHNEAALAWIARADTFMPGSPLVQAWLASVYTAMGDARKAADHVAILKKIAPAGTERFASRRFKPVPAGWPRTRILEGLRVALAGSPG
jgi:DNA-binding SARP family transcriptional activator/TolB-like protein/Tfp pilus assembly protein PilF